MTLQANRVKIGNVTFMLIESRGGFIGPDSSNLHEAFTQTALSDAHGGGLGSTELFTGKIRAPLGSGYKKDGRIFFRQKDPLPVTLGAVIPEVSVGGSSGG